MRKPRDAQVPEPCLAVGIDADKLKELRAQQITYEIEMDRQAANKALAELRKKAVDGDISTPKAQRLIRSVFDTVEGFIKEAQERKGTGLNASTLNWLRLVPSDVAAAAAIRSTIALCSTPGKYCTAQRLCSTIGKMYEIEARVRMAEKVHPVIMRQTHESLRKANTKSVGHLIGAYRSITKRLLKDVLEDTLSLSEVVRLGQFGAEACYQAGMLKIDRFRDHRNKHIVRYELDDELMKYLIEYDEDEVQRCINRQETRMLCPPEPISSAVDSGYLTPRRKLVTPLIQRTGGSGQRKSTYEKIKLNCTPVRAPKFYTALNYLQSIPYKLHEPTAKAMLETWKRGGACMGLPSVSAPNPPAFPFPEGWDKHNATPEEKELLSQWRKAAHQVYTLRTKWRSRCLELGAILRICRQSLSTPQFFWFPVHADFRGRLYYYGIPNPQGSDYSRPLLHFAEERELGKEGLFWLKVHIANSYGFDKVSFQERAEWTEKNWGLIERALDAPWDNPEVFGDAPWSTYSAAWELREALRRPYPERYKTGIIIQMDASSSAFQHFAALLRDPVAAEMVNIIPADKHCKADIYSRVAAIALQEIKQDLENPEFCSNEIYKAIAQWCLDVGIPRKVAKRPVMVQPYSASLFRCADYIMGDFDKLLPGMGKAWLHPDLKFKTSLYLAKKLHSAIKHVLPSAVFGMHWLQGVVDAVIKRKQKEPVHWVSPSGFPVYQDCLKPMLRRVNIRTCGVKSMNIRSYTEEVDRGKSLNSIAPNFVHSMDAAHLHLVACRMQQENLRMQGIHDSFGTHASDVGRMHRIIREEFVRMYSEHDPFLELLKSNRLEQEIELPDRGELDISVVLDSTFFFA
jgi:DNA-directed RNA polymerase